MLKIGDFSRLAQVSIKTLRYYGRLGLFRPAWIDRFTGYRYYALDQLPRLNRILALKDLGFSLEQVKGIMRDDVSAAELYGMLRLKRAELASQVQAEQARLARVTARLKQIQQEGVLPETEVILKNVAPQLVLGIRDTISGYASIARLGSELQSYAQQRGVEVACCGPCTVLYYDDEYRECELDVEVALPISRVVPGTTRISAHVLQGEATMACAIHQGSYETLSEAYSVLTAWTQASGYRVAGPNRETYFQIPGPGVEEADRVTEIQIPVESVWSNVPKEHKEQIMEPKIEVKPAFTIVGMRSFGKNESGEITAMWARLGPRWSEFRNRASGDAYGVCFEANDDGDFEYIAGVDVTSDKDLPEGMVSRRIPASKYAVFPCTLATISKAYGDAFSNWLPQSGHRRRHSPDFELYDENFDPSDAESVMYVYIPID
jgi:predicted transcriptional regulator YdeE/effector-binding domain-containing protein